MKKILLALSLLCSHWAFGQYTLSYGNNSLEISGLVTTFYNYRFLDSNNPSNHIGNQLSNPLDQKKNTFSLGNMRLKLEGRMGKEWEMVFHMDFSKLGQTTNVGEFPAILDAYGVYKGLKWLDVSMGFQKLPYGRFSQVSFSNEIFWQRAEIARGNVFSRRDLGLVLAKDFMNERLNVSVGAFTGQGENILTSVTNGDNDPSGTFEYSGRLSYSWPKKIKTSYVIDKDYSEKPMFSVGVSGRYVNRAKSITGIADYDLKIVAGDRMIGSLDASMWWKGFNLMAEYHVGQYRPTGADTSRLYGKNTDFFRVGGLITQVSYYSEKLRSAFALRYDSFSPNDLIRSNTEQTLSFGYNYYFKNSGSILRIHYFKRLDPTNEILLRTDDQLRLGWALVF